MTQTTLSGRYRLETVLGQGGMGQVHLAHDTLLERRVAVKMLPEDAERDPLARQRLRREALAAAALDHPFICKIHEVGEDAGRSFIVMEFIDGRTLNDVARNGGVQPRELLDIAHEITQALDEAHRRGIVHRDLKPSNIMLTVQGHVKVLDFGLAKHVTPQPTHDTRSGPLTDPGTRLGTPAYMSPEQVLGAPLDPRSDVFSLGAVLHELASGRHPFLKDSAGDTMAAILRDPPAATEGDLDVVPGLGRIVHRMLAKACAERYQSMGELKAALDDLRVGSSRATPSSGSTVASPVQSERTPFVSRDSELAELTGALDRMLLGQGGFVLLGGEPGVGKTRLAREIQRLSHARGCLVLTGQCYEQEGAPPFGPFVEILEYAARLLPNAFRASLGDGAAEIATIAPSLRRIYNDIPPASVVPAEQQRRLVFNAYLEHLQRATLKSAAVVLLDDLHWADDSTLQMLLHIAPHARAMRVLVIGTYRDVELDTERPFAKALETLLRQRLATRINVKRLTSAGVEQMLSTMSGAPPPSSLVRIVFEETDGNPFFVEEVFQHLSEEGKIFDADGNWKTDLRADEIDVPEGVRLVVSRRLERLGENARKVLTAAAVIGRSFPLDLLIAVADGTEEQVLDVVEEAERAQLIASERGRQARYTFVHELIRSTLVSGMALPRRQRLHVRVADAIEQLRAGALDSHVSMLAHHLYQAGAAVEQGRAVRYLLLAARRAQESHASSEALELCDQLDSLELPANTIERATIDETRSLAFLALRRPADATAPAERALAAWIARRDDAGILRAADAVCNTHIWQARFADGLAVIERALAALSPSAERERCRLQAGYAAWTTTEQRFEDARTMLENAMSTADRVGDASLRGFVVGCAANLERQLGRISAALDRATRALELLDDTELWNRTEASFTRTICLYYSGEFEALQASAAETTALAHRAGHGGALWVVQRATGAASVLKTGELRLYREAVERELADTMQWPFATRMFSAVAGFYLGDRTACDLMERVIAEQPPGTWIDCLPVANLMAMHAWTGAADRARDLSTALEPRLARAGKTSLLGQWSAVPTVIGALALLGDRAACASLYPAARAFIDSGMRWDMASVGPNTPHLGAAIAADAAGDASLARDHFEQALRLADDLPSRLHQPTVRLWFGRHLTSYDDATVRARGVAMLKDAEAGFRALGMVIHQEHAARWLANSKS